MAYAHAIMIRTCPSFHNNSHTFAPIWNIANLFDNMLEPGSLTMK